MSKTDRAILAGLSLSLGYNFAQHMDGNGSDFRSILMLVQAVLIIVFILYVDS